MPKDIKSKKGFIVSQEETTLCSLIVRGTPSVRFCEKTKATRAQVWNKTVQARGRDYKRLDHGRSQNSEQDNIKTRKHFHCGRQFHELDPESIDEYQNKHRKQCRVFTQILFSVSEPRNEKLRQFQIIY